MIAIEIIVIPILVALLYGLKVVFPRLGTGNKYQDIQSRWSNTLKPTVGGIFFLMVFGFSFIEGFQSSSSYIGLGISALLAFGIGLWDDIKRLPAKTKLVGQILAAALFAYSGNGLFQLEETSYVLSIINMLGAMLLAVACMNSVNMMDNMDTVSSISVLPALIMASSLGLDHFLYVNIVIALIAFLILNWYPSKVFMGDSGTLLLGIVLAHSLVHFNETHSKSIALDLARMLAVTTVLITDSLVVIINRISHGQSPMQGGKDHTSHQMAYLGLKPREISVLWIFLQFIPVIVFEMGQFLIRNNASDPLWSIAPSAVYFAMYFGTMMIISRRNLRLGKFTYAK